jgi:hypothetical protein
MEASSSNGGGGGRGRVLPALLVVLATIVGIMSVFAVWGKRQLLESDTWADTSARLIANHDIQVAVADFITTSIYDNVDVQGNLEQKLPPDLKPLAGPIAGAARNVTDDVALKALQQPKVQQLWVEANRTAHDQLVELIRDRNDYVSTTGGVVTVDLKSIIAAVTEQIGIGGKLVDKLPDSAASFEVTRADELETAQRAINLLETLAWVLTGLTFVLYGAAIAVARDRRRETLRSAGIGFVVIGVFVLLARGFARDAVVSSLSETPSTDAAVRAAFEEGTSLLVETCQSIVAYGVVIILAAWLAGPTSWAVSVRRGVTPYLRQPRFAYGGLAVLLALLFWWDPVVATHRLAPSLLLIALLVIGTEALRRQVIREFPDAVTPRSPAGIARGMADWAAAQRERRIARRAEAATAATPPSAESAAADRVALLERLAALKESGVLSEEELAAEKARLLSA